MKIPTLNQAEALLSEAEALNPGPWVEHSIYVAKAASAIAKRHPNLDSDTAFIFGCLHDIGRRVGVTDMRHVLDGYTFCEEHGYTDAARICLTHSFPILLLESAAGKWDCTPDEMAFMREYLAHVQLDEYDSLIQLCDALALPSGFTLMEKRLVDVVVRHDFNEYTIPRWKAYFSIKQRFEDIIGCSLYSVLPGVVENTFGFKSETYA